MADLTREELAALRLGMGGISGPIKVHHEALEKLIAMAERCVSEETVRLLGDYIAMGAMGVNRWGRFANAAYRELRGVAEARTREGR